MSHRRHKTLVIHTGGIGDLILSCPAIAALGEGHPVDILGRPDRAVLLKAAGLVHHILDIDNAGFESIFDQPSERLKELLRPYNRAVAWMSDPDGAITRGLSECGVESAICFHGLPPATWPRHASAYFLHCVGQDPEAIATSLPVAPTTERHDVVIHPGSGSPKKNWPMEHFEAVAAELEAAGRRVLWCLGPAEIEAGLATGKRALGIEALDDLAAALAATRLYIGNDAGITHLASAVGCPTVAIFGPTDPAVWAPLGTRVTVVRGVGWPEVGTVLQAVASLASA